MAKLEGQSIAASYDQLLHVDTEGGGATTTLVPIKDGDNGTTFAAQLSTTTICIDNPTTSSSSQGGILRLQSDDGAALGDTHRLGVIEFSAAEDGSNTITTGARIEAIADAAWSASENGADMVFYTTDGNASQGEVMRLSAAGNVGIGVSPETDWHSTWSALQFGGNGALSAHASAGAGKAVFLSQNARYISSNSSDGAKYIDTDEASEVFLVDGTIRLRTAVSGAADAAITWTTPMVIDNSGDVTFTGDLIMADGKGINFAAMTSPADASGMTAEILDDYEEGTWTAGVTDGSNPMTMDGSYITGYYTKVGNLVTVTGFFVTTSLGSASGAIRITGLPFTIVNNAAAYTTGGARGGGMAITAGHSVSYYGEIGNTNIHLEVWDDAAGVTAMQASEWSADGRVMIDFSYRAA